MNSKQNNKVSRMVKIALFSALSFVVMLFSFPLPFLPPFLHFDFSDVIILFSGFVLGGWDMLIVAIIKNILHWLMKGATFGLPLDQFASLLSTVSFTYPFYFLMKKYGFDTASIGQKITTTAIATLCLTATMFISNYFFITPAYFKLWGADLPQPFFQFMLAYIPFNAIKGIVLGSVFLVPAVERLMKKMK